MIAVVPGGGVEKLTIFFLDPVCLLSLVWSTPNLSGALGFLRYLPLENPIGWDIMVYTGILAHTCNHITGDQVGLM